MRTDIRIDRQFVRCPHASTLAYGKWRAQAGDWLTWTYDGHTSIGRVIGRVAYDPWPSAADYQNCTGWIVVLRLSPDLTHAAEYWINPEWVTRIHANRPDIGAFLQLISGELPSVEECRVRAEYGRYSADLSADQSWPQAEKERRFLEYWQRRTQVTP